MKSRISRLIVLSILCFVFSVGLNVKASSNSRMPIFSPLQLPLVADVFQPPLGINNGITFAPRRTYLNSVLIEDTDYGVKNPDLNEPDTCFNVDWRELYHAGEDLYNNDNPNATVNGEIVTAVANGKVYNISDPGVIWYDGYAVTIEHELSSGQKVYSVYIHLAWVDVQQDEEVTRGQSIGTVIYQPYTGLYEEQHSTDDSHLHFEIRYFPDARGIYTGYPRCEKGDVAGRGYTPPDIYPDNYPSPGAGYTDPTDFINAHSTPPSPTPTLTATPTSTLTSTPTLVATPSHTPTSTPTITVTPTPPPPIRATSVQPCFGLCYM